MADHGGEIIAFSKPVTPTHASYPSGILRSPRHNKSPNTFPLLPDVYKPTNDLGRNSEDENDKRPAKNQKQAELLRVRRWSNPDISAKEKKRREKLKNVSFRGHGSLQVAGSFDVYDFYINKVNTNTDLIRGERDKRLKWDLKSQAERKQLRRGYMFHTSPSCMESKILEWMQQESKYRKHVWEFRTKERPDQKRPSFSAHPMSRTSVHFAPDPNESISRKDSFIVKMTRKSSLWQQPSDLDHLRKDKVRKFKWYCKVIKALCGLKMEMQKLSMSKTEQTSVSEFMYISSGAMAIPPAPGKEGEDDESQHLLFDKSMFSRKKATSHMPGWAISLMIEPPNRRPDDQVQHLKQLLLGMKSFREKITESMRFTVAKVVRYTKCDKGRVILRQGHWGFDFYFIYSGSVFIQLELKDPKTGETYPSVENVLKSGEGFGEIALLGDGKRTASVICKEPTELCQIDRGTFLEICPALYNEQLEEKISFAKNFPLFSFLEPETLKKLCFLSQVLDIPHSTIVENDWSVANFAYFVMKGQMKMVKRFDATRIENASSQERALGHVDNPNRSKVKCVSHTKNALVGLLGAGTHTDLSILSLEPRKNIEKILLVSEGVRVFRVSARTMSWVCPRKAVEEYLKRVYVPPTFPSDEEMSARYHINISWGEFKKNVVSTSRLEQSGQVISNIPATLKGTTGWARWPGYRLRPKDSMHPKFGRDRLISLTDQFWDEEDDDNDYMNRSTSIASSSSLFTDDATASYDRGFDLSRTKSPIIDLIHVTEKASNDRTLNLKPPTFRTMAHLRQSMNKPNDVRSL